MCQSKSKESKSNPVQFVLLTDSFRGRQLSEISRDGPKAYMSAKPRLEALSAGALGTKSNSWLECKEVE